MKNSVRHSLLPVILLVLLLNLFLTGPVRASFNYSGNDGSIFLGFDDSNDLGSCNTASFWLISLSYNNGTTKQGPVHDMSSTQTTDSFNIPNGTPIQDISVWAGSTSEEASSGSCTHEVANNSDGIFNWTNNSSSAPVISDLLVSNVTSSSVTVSWTTDVAATAAVDYGETNSYGSTQSDSTSSTSHSVALTGLTANTTYHYNAKSTGDSGTGESGDNTFVTAAEGTTGSNQSGTTGTTIRTNSVITATPTPTPVPDRVPPAVSLSTDFSKPFLKPPTISGKASDASGISKVEYSTDDGRNWNAVDEIADLGARFVDFTFTPPPLDDDNYKIRIRAVDNARAKNVRISDPYTLIIDRLPPEIGGNIIAIGPQVLFPNDQGYLLTTKNVHQKITVSAVGGPVEIVLSAAQSATSESATTYSLVRNSDNGLWSADLQFAKTGIYQLSGKSTDGAGNTTNRLLNKVAVLAPGAVVDAEKNPVKNARVTLYYFENKYQIWRVWDGPSYNQKNPVTTNTAGEFSYLVPSGKYYFDIEAYGFIHTQSEIFTIDGPTILNPTFALKPQKALFTLFGFTFYLPDFSTSTVAVNLALPNLPDEKGALIGQQAPNISLPTTDNGQFNLSSNRGTPLVLTFMSSWSPQTTEQILALDQLAGTNNKYFVVMLGDTLSKIELLQKRGDYKTTFMVDADGKSIEPYQINTLPAHYFIDRRGVVKQIMTGVLSAQEIKDALLNTE